MHEFDIINKYFKVLSKKSSSSLNLNDDIFFDKKKKLAITVDTYNEGIHFVNFKNPDLVIKKIIRSSISDLISKGVKPFYYFISASGNKKSFSKRNLYLINKSLNQEQNKYKIFLGGGDTVFSKNLSFTITFVGFAENIIYRNNAKVNDDIYVSGFIGDSYIGLLALKNKIKLNNKLNKYFVNQFFLPNIQFKLIQNLKKFANTSIDISDGLFADMDKMINTQNLSYKIKIDNIPISNNFKRLINVKKLSKINYITKGDDYQVLFTASKNKKEIIQKFSKKTGVRITKIGTIQKYVQNSLILDHNNVEIKLKNKGYLHKF